MTPLFMLQKSISLSPFSFLLSHGHVTVHVVTADLGVELFYDNGEVMARYCIYFCLWLLVEYVLVGIF